MTVLAIVPSIGESPHLRALCETLLNDVDRVMVYVNREQVALNCPPGVHRVDVPGLSLAAVWNAGIAQGRAGNFDAVAVLNDDIRLTSDSVSSAAEWLDYDPHLWAVGLDFYEREDRQLRYCQGTFRHSCVPGFAFIVDPIRCPEVDTQFEWWGQDDALMFDIAALGGRIGVAEGSHVWHTAETTASKYSWTYEARARDRERFAAKYGEHLAW